MEGLIWYVHFIIRKRKVGRGGGGVLLKFVELSCGIGFLLICERRTPLASLRMLLKNIFSQALMGMRRTPLASLRMLLKNISQALMGIRRTPLASLRMLLKIFLT